MRHLDRAIASVANESGDIDIVPAQIWSGVEQVNQVSAPDDGSDLVGCLHIKALPPSGRHSCPSKGSKHCCRRTHVDFLVWVMRGWRRPQHSGIVLHAVSVAAPSALHDRWPRSGFGEQERCGEIDSSLQNLRADDDLACEAWRGQGGRRVGCPVGGPVAGM